MQSTPTLSTGEVVDGGTGAVCVPTCASNSNCALGARLQACSSVSAMDGGSPPMVCHYLACQDSSTCGTGYHCADNKAGYGDGFCEKNL